jgi:hypothetical protein
MKNERRSLRLRFSFFCVFLKGRKKLEKIFKILKKVLHSIIGCDNIYRLCKGDKGFLCPEKPKIQQICDDSEGGHPWRWGISAEYVRF